MPKEQANLIRVLPEESINIREEGKPSLILNRMLPPLNHLIDWTLDPKSLVDDEEGEWGSWKTRRFFDLKEGILECPIKARGQEGRAVICTSLTPQEYFNNLRTISVPRSFERAILAYKDSRYKHAGYSYPLPNYEGRITFRYQETKNDNLVLEEIYIKKRKIQAEMDSLTSFR